MKKLLTLLGLLTLITTSSAIVVACEDKTKQDTHKPNSVEESRKKEDKTQKPKKQEEQKEKTKEEVQTDQPDSNNNYSLKRSLKENFELIKKYGREAADLIFPRADLIESLRSKQDTKDTISLISKIISIYTEFNEYSNIEEFKSKSGNYNTKIKDKELDELVTKYEEQKDNISKLFEKFK
ncbi:lipoprotein [Mycoplasma mycoides]|uniref:lipoprotein n=1 Tax=Mycoplasma mycoides TaxID=2102 RepID=UPI0022404FDC|nr:lipoprotein [Mycoplasma mycoides]QVK08776.1 lipoprotein [Mycoplasma mycoides subsp. capri]